MTEDPEYDFDGLDRRLNRYSLIITLAAIPIVFAGHSLKEIVGTCRSR